MDAMRKCYHFFRRTWTSIRVAPIVVLMPGCLLWAQQGDWITKAPMPTVRCCLATAVIDDVMYAVGGFADPFGNLSTVEAYTPKTNTWTRKAPMPTPRDYVAAGAVDGVLYVVGGQGSTAPYLATVEAYDPETNTWSNKAPMLTPRMGLTVATADGILYALGGDNESGLVATVEAYDPKKDTWSSQTPMPTAQFHFAAGVVNGIIFAVGGNNVRDGRIRTVEAYDPKTNTWSTKTPMPTARDGFTVAVVDGTLYAIGGTDGGMFATVEAYDPKTDAWTSESPMPTGRHDLASGIAYDTVYAVGGLGFNPGLGSEPFLGVNEAFNPFLHIAIDIKPGDPRNTINLKSAGTVPVAILGSATFDPMTVDPATVTLAGAPVATRGRGQPMTSQGDFNHDGYLDLLLHFRTQDLKLTPTSTEDVLYGETFSGQRLRGADSVRIVSFLSPRAPIGNPNPKKRNSRLSRLPL